MKPYYRLNFPVKQFINDDIDLSDFPKTFEPFADGTPRLWGVKYYPNEKILTQEFIDFLASLDFHPPHTHIFMGPPQTELFIHKDAPSSPTNAWAFNFSWGTDSSEMRWYEINEGQAPVVKHTLTDRYVDTWTADQCTLIDRAEMRLTATLVRVDLAHHAVNMGTTTRWSASVRDQHFWTWKEAVKFFEPWIVE
jgi:hypothetical protein